jgi:hypothetical protein
VTLPAGPHEVTAEFLGTAEAAGSVGTLAFTVRTPSGQALVVEEVATGTGPAVAEEGGTSRVLYTAGSPEVVIDDPDTGEIRVDRAVPGVGSVSVALRPRFPIQNIGFGWDAIVAVLGIDGSLTVPEPRLGLRTHRITVDGDAWGASCPVVFRRIGVSGRLTDRGFEVRYDGRANPVKPSERCDAAQAALVDQVLGGRFVLDLLAPGDFPPLLGSDDPTRTVVSATPTSAVVGDRVRIDVAVTYGEAPDELPAPGTVRLLLDGTEIQSRSLSSTGQATFSVLSTSPGSATFTAVYDGPAGPSSDTVVVDVAPFAVGRATTGTISLDTATSPLPPGAVWTGGEYDPLTGEIGPGRLVSPVGVVDVPVDFLGLSITAEARFVSLDDATGRVLADGSVEIGPVPMAIEVRSVSILGSFDACSSHPFDVVLRGTVDAAGLRVAHAAIPHSGFPSAACGLIAGFFNPAGVQLGLSLAVAGDFPLPPA